MALFTLHKLVTIGLIIFLAITVSKIHQVTPLTTQQMLPWQSLRFLFIATIATGGMLSVDKVFPPIVSVLHKVLPLVTLVSTSVSFYLLLF